MLKRIWRKLRQQDKLDKANDLLSLLCANVEPEEIKRIKEQIKAGRKPATATLDMIRDYWNQPRYLE